MTEITLNKDEHIEYLRKDFGLIVSKEHTFGTDALLLADFASPKRYDICCDFGTGCGIIPMLWCRDGCGKEISAVENLPFSDFHKYSRYEHYRNPRPNRQGYTLKICGYAL